MTTPIGSAPAPITLGQGLLRRTHEAFTPEAAPSTGPVAAKPSTAIVERLAGQGVNALASTVEGMTPDSPLDEETMLRLGKIDEAAKAFEQIFVRQLLKSTKLGSGGDYASMTTDALSQGVAQGGGMGLAGMIRDTLVRAEMPGVARDPRLASALQSLETQRRTPLRTDS